MTYLVHTTSMRKIEDDDYSMNLILDPANKRLRVDDYVGNPLSIIAKVDQLADTQQVEKMIIFAKKGEWQTFLSRGYRLEGVFKGYYSGSDAYGLAKYKESKRQISAYGIKEDTILQEVFNLPVSEYDIQLGENFLLRPATLDDAEELSFLYGSVFETYPTPMNHPAYIRKVMDSSTIFQVIESNGKIVSAASAEINVEYHHAEITDCATLPDFRKHGLMKGLVQALEYQLRKQKVYYAFSLARALSFGMNKVFHQMGYQYSGRMVNNCDIFGKYEDMNLWNKNLSTHEYYK